jgi:hypothetical protein
MTTATYDPTVPEIDVPGDFNYTLATYHTLWARNHLCRVVRENRITDWTVKDMMWAATCIEKAIEALNDGLYDSCMDNQDTEPTYE